MRISNGCDAITKLKKLELMGEFEKPEELEYKIQVTVNPTDKTITFCDNGLGMTEEEVEEYINQIAFSGAQDFLNKYKDKANEDQIIGHFGLGFYSAFMVADKVTIDTLSYKNGAKAVHWESEGGTEYEMTDGDRTQFGTTITLYLNEDSVEFSNEYRAREVIEKYCSFMPVPIFLNNATAEPQYALQNDGFVKKISDYITKKVADKLSGMCKTDRENYEKYWDDISPFIKFGCLKDEKFEEKMQEYVLFKNLEGKYLTLTDCRDDAKEKHENIIYYVTDEKEQSQYIQMFKKEGLDAVLLGHNIDSPFIGRLEQKNEGLKFLRIDADVTSTMKEEVREEEAESFKADSEKLQEIFKKALGNDKLTITVEKLKDDQVASMITVSEEDRRMQDMKYVRYGSFDVRRYGRESGAER